MTTLLEQVRAALELAPEPNRDDTVYYHWFRDDRAAALAALDAAQEGLETTPAARYSYRQLVDALIQEYGASGFGTRWHQALLRDFDKLILEREAKHRLIDPADLPSPRPACPRSEGESPPGWMQDDFD